DELGPALSQMPPHESRKIGGHIFRQDRLPFYVSLSQPGARVFLCPTPPRQPVVIRIDSRCPQRPGPTARELLDRGAMQVGVATLNVRRVESDLIARQSLNRLNHLGPVPAAHAARLLVVQARGLDRLLPG